MMTKIMQISNISKTYKKVIKVKLIINKKTLGAGRSRNIGISKSSSNILLLDADDLWKKTELNYSLIT